MPICSMHTSKRPASFPEAQGPSDSDAIQKISGGSHEMFAVIVRRYNARLYRVGMAYLRDHTQTEDAMQNAYLKCFLNLHRFRGRAGFATWLTRIMINECLMLLRRKKGAPWESLDAAFAPRSLELLAPETEDAASLGEMRALLEEGIRVLPRNQRAVYLLREVQKISTAETAACLRLSPANVKVLLHRAKERLKEELLKTAAAAELFEYRAVRCEPMTQRVMRAVEAVRQTPAVTSRAAQHQMD